MENIKEIVEQTKEDKIREQNRIRAKRRYDKAKEEINERRRLQYLEKKEQNEPVQVTEPEDPLLPKNDILLSNLMNLHLNENTKKKYIADFNRLLNIINNTDVMKALKNGLQLIQAIEDSDYSTNTKRGIVQICLFMITQFKLVVNKESRNHLSAYFEKQKVIAVEENESKMENIIVPRWADYLNQVKEIFGQYSKMYLIVLMYHEITLRDDFQLMIVEKKPKNNDKNYLVLSKNNFQLIINNYKTVGKYGSFAIKLTKGLTNLIQKYMENNNLKLGDYLFGENKLSNFITVGTSKAGINGGINLYRHMTVTEELSKIKDVSERQALADKMRHSVFTQAKYMRQFENPL
jgi:uncharacterized protein related to proFAR isomerase